MKAEDFKPNNRFFVSKEVAKEFIKDRQFDRIGLVIFSAIAFTQCPLTLDHGALLDFVDKVQIGSTNTDGTAIGSAIATSVARFKTINSKSKIVILMTDGRNNTGEIDPITASKIAKTLGVKVYTIGVGTKGEALFPIDDPMFGKRYIKIQEDLDEDTLKGIAKLTDAQYFRATDESSLRDIYKIIDKLEKTDVKIKEYTEYKELYLYFLIPALLLFLLEILLSNFLWIKIP
jgi:Ca-activated chloride channel family protein